MAMMAMMIGEERGTADDVDELDERANARMRREIRAAGNR